jgi:hypothetical protein
MARYQPKLLSFTFCKIRNKIPISDTFTIFFVLKLNTLQCIVMPTFVDFNGKEGFFGAHYPAQLCEDYNTSCVLRKSNV